MVAEARNKRELRMNSIPIHRFGRPLGYKRDAASQGRPPVCFRVGEPRAAVERGHHHVDISSVFGPPAQFFLDSNKQDREA
jgi:hypothetical protein